MRRINPAEDLLKKFGITEPKEIDLEAIAYDQGAKIRFRNLTGCEANILGHGDKAIISVDKSASPARKRFSIAHELGHWHHHRGKKLACRVDEYQPKHAKPAEQKADAYAASLLMPFYLFKPIAEQHNRLTFKVITDLADIFKTSLTATAIRLIDADVWPALLICSGPNGRKWFCRAPIVPQRWYPKQEIDAESSALEILFGNTQNDRGPRIIGAESWFERREAEKFEIREQSFRSGANEVLTLLTFSDEQMLKDEKRGGGWSKW